MTTTTTPRIPHKFLALSGLGLLLTSRLAAQDLEPRRWSHLPTGLNFNAFAYAYTEGDIYFDPMLDAEDVVLIQHSFAAKYIRSFGLLGRSGRAEVTLPYHDAQWKGLLSNEPTRVCRRGFGDPSARLTTYLVGAPPLKGKEFAKYRETHQSETLVGLGLAVSAPLGQYFDDKLINLGENRFTFRPELGIQHNHGKWTEELTGSATFYTTNDDFWNGKTRSQDPYFGLQGHLAYTFMPGLWLGTSLGYAYGGESEVNGRAKQDTKENVLWSLSLSLPLSKSSGLKLAYVKSNTKRAIGGDYQSFVIAWSMMW